jgi:8-oxo-dGTP pyrophosphatase MutT (NUDIX family)
MNDVGRRPRGPDFGIDAFLGLLGPHLVDDPAVLPARPIFGDRLLDPDLPPPEKPLRDAAVLVGMVARHGGASVILTQRTAHLLTHAGQIAFPGGKIDAGDADAVAAALREAEEEIGLARPSVAPVGCFPPYASNSGFRIVPVIGVVDPRIGFSPNPDEVADVFEVPLSFLMDGANHRVSHLVWQGRKRHFYEMPYEGRRIWGVTAGIIRKIFEATYGIGAPPAPGTPVRVPGERR